VDTPACSIDRAMGLPTFFVDFAEDSWQERILIGIFTSMAMFSYDVFKRIGSKYPTLKDWGTTTLFGTTITLFFLSLLAPAFAVLFAMLPLPVLIHSISGLALAIVALGLLTHESSASK
jgi:hypothetical protein